MSVCVRKLSVLCDLKVRESLLVTPINVFIVRARLLTFHSPQLKPWCWLCQARSRNRIVCGMWISRLALCMNGRTDDEKFQKCTNPPVWETLPDSVGLLWSLETVLSSLTSFSRVPPGHLVGIEREDASLPIQNKISKEQWGRIRKGKTEHSDSITLNWLKLTSKNWQKQTLCRSFVHY